MGLQDFMLNCEKDNKQLRKDIQYYKNKSQRLQQENQKYKELIDRAIALVNDPWSLESGNEKVDEITVRKKKELLDILNGQEGEWMIKQTEITLDIIPIYINEMYPKKEGIYHYGCVIDSIEKNTVQA